MNAMEFIEKNVKQVLVSEGFTVPLAQGGRGRLSSITSRLHRPARRERCLMTAYIEQECGQKQTPPKTRSQRRKPEPEKQSAHFRSSK